MAAKPKLKGHAPELIKPRKPKILVYGASGVGKTWAALDFPDVYMIDVEGGATQPEYRAKLAASGGLYLGPDDGAASFDEVMGQIRALSSERHDRKTLVIDVQPADALVLSTRNLPGVRLVPANRVTARDVMDCAKVIASQAALTRLQEALA